MQNRIKQRELICIYPLGLTLEEGDHYIFVAIDVATEFAFEPLIEKNDEIQNLLVFIKQLLKDKNFMMNDGEPFTLILSRYEKDFPEIEKLIKPFGGSVAIDEELVLETMTPFIEEFYGSQNQEQPLENAIDLPDEGFGDAELSFIAFLRLLPKQTYHELNEFLDLAIADKTFVFTSDPQLLSDYLYKKLDPKQTLAFQKMFLIYASVVPENTIPVKYLSDPGAMLQGLNHILSLQDSDSEYPFAGQLIPNRKK